MGCCKCCSPTCSIISIVVSIIICCLGITLKIIMPGILENAILKSFVLSEDSMMYEYWVEPPVSLDAQFYVFNYTNYKEFSVGWAKNGTKPRVQQLGPYVFRFSMRRKDVKFYGKDEVEYILLPEMQFIPELSNGTSNDVIIIPNIILRAIVQHPAVKSASMIVKNLLQMHNYSYYPFVKHTIGELLVDGFYDPILSQVKGFTGMALSNDNLFRIKDVLFQPILKRAKTGAGGYKEFGQMVAFKNQTVLKVWPKGSVCNEVRGAETGGFPPKLPIDQRVHIYIGELCRSIFLRFEKPVDHYGIKANRFSLDPDVMSNTNPEYECFCMSQNNKCWGSGLFNIGQCQFGVPMLLSLPHLLNTEYRIKNAIDGLAPDPEKHQFFMDLEITTSLPVNVSAGLQLNIAVESSSIGEANNLPEIILPIMYIANNVDLNETASAMIKMLLVDVPLAITDTIPMTIFAIGNIIGLLGISCSVNLMFKANKVHAVQPVTEKFFVKRLEY